MRIALSNREKLAHLMRRAGFGVTSAELDQLERQSVESVVQNLLNSASQPDNPEADAYLDSLVARDREQRLRPQMLKPWWIYRMTTTKRPFIEKMTLFWHGHFATSLSKVQPPDLMLQQNRFFRDNALGNWRSILQGISRDPAMIRWLDNDQNFKLHPNENYARELMELFSLGIGHYTETDVKESGRAFTGWSQQGGNFAFIPARHDDGVKSFLGHTGNFDGDDIIEIILEQPAAPEFITRKLFAYFAYENPEPDVVKDLAATFRNSNYEIRALMQAIFESEAFWSHRAVNTQIKSPAQLVVGSLREMGLKDAPPPVEMGVMGPAERRSSARVWLVASNAVKLMGQDLFYPPNVKGWDGGATWVNSATMLARINYASNLVRLVAQRGIQAFEPVTGDLTESPDAVVNRVLQNLGPLKVPEDVKGTIQKPLESLTPGVRPRAVSQAAATVVALAMQSPQYQLC